MVYLNFQSVMLDHSPSNVKLDVLIGRLAIDTNFQNQGYGKFLIADAIHKIKSTAVAAAILVVEAKNDNAFSFYERLGFVEFKELEKTHRKLFYPLTKIIK